MSEWRVDDEEVDDVDAEGSPAGVGRRGRGSDTGAPAPARSSEGAAAAGTGDRYGGCFTLSGEITQCCCWGWCCEMWSACGGACWNWKWNFSGGAWLDRDLWSCRTGWTTCVCSGLSALGLPFGVVCCC